MQQMMHPARICSKTVASVLFDWMSYELLQVYQELCQKHKTFRERSENVDLAVRLTSHHVSYPASFCTASTQLFTHM